MVSSPSRGASAAMGVVGWTLTGLATLALLAVAIFVAHPATTHPIVGDDGEPVPGSVAELITVPIGGHDQVMMIRARSPCYDTTTGRLLGSRCDYTMGHLFTWRYGGQVCRHPRHVKKRLRTSRVPGAKVLLNGW
jgi:hypothetical protein